jgi:hypothetical protein
MAPVFKSMRRAIRRRRPRVGIRGDTFGKEPANIQWNHNPGKHTASLDARGDATGGRIRCLPGL